MTILDTIVAAKKLELEQQKHAIPLATLRQWCDAAPAPCGFAKALSNKGVSLIAEVKKASPSKGLLRPDFSPVELATTYANAGASAISVLTDSHFQGELAHLSKVKRALGRTTPVLRKDFIFDPYQVYQAKAAGADAILLIVAMLEREQLAELHALAMEISLDCLVEIHNEAELETAASIGAQVIGINNRDLHTFHTDLAVTARLAPKVPPSKTIVSESGISAPQHLAQLAELGVHAALVGEALVTQDDVAAAVRHLLSAPAETGQSQAAAQVGRS